MSNDKLANISTRFELVAVRDGCGESAVWGLYVEYDGEPVADLAWPKDWPERVDGQFLREKGFKTSSA